MPVEIPMAVNGITICLFLVYVLLATTQNHTDYNRPTKIAFAFSLVMALLTGVFWLVWIFYVPFRVVGS